MAKPVKRDLSWVDAIKEVLQEADGALHYSEIAERVAAQGLRAVGANPAASVSAIISNSINNDESSPFQWVDRGIFILKPAPRRTTTRRGPKLEPAPEAPETGALRAFGMFWSRDQVLWSGNPKLLGRQQLGAADVNFSEQVGVYLLHDRERVIYVGRASDALSIRLKAHTSDRMGGRWDRFSWFGLRTVMDNGSLSDPAVHWSYTVVIETMEALLIESLEPPLNRKRGDNFSGVEYLQVADPEIEKLNRKRILDVLVRNADL